MPLDGTSIPYTSMERFAQYREHPPLNSSRAGLRRRGIYDPRSDDEGSIRFLLAGQLFVRKLRNEIGTSRLEHRSSSREHLVLPPTTENALDAVVLPIVRRKESALTPRPWMQNT